MYLYWYKKIQMARHKLVIIGNGFDLAHSIESRYTDFLKYYLTQAIKEVDNNPQKKYEGGLVVREGGALDKQIKTEDLMLIELYDEMLSVGFRPTQFLSSLISKLKISDSLDWVDIEYEYFKELSKVYRQISNSQESIETIRVKYKNLENLNTSLNYTKNKLANYLGSEAIRNKTDENTIIKEHVTAFVESVALGAKTVINFHGMPKLFILNFNYTSTINDYLINYDKKKFNYEVVNIHGSINNINSIIFGYGDMMDTRFKEIENYNDNNFFRNIKQFHYLQSDAYHKLISFMNQCDVNNKYDIHIMGHYCGMSDRVLFNKILNRDKCEKIYLYYHIRKEGDDDFFEKIINISRHFDEKNKEYFIEMMAAKADCKTLT